MSSEIIERANEQREAQRHERVERLLSGKLGRHVKRASELAFDYTEATALAANHQTPHRW